MKKKTVNRITELTPLLLCVLTFYIIAWGMMRVEYVTTAVISLSTACILMFIGTDAKDICWKLEDIKEELEKK